MAEVTPKQEPQEDETENTPPELAPKPVQAPSPGPGPSPAPSASFQSSRPLYLQQFTAATQMILKRMKGEPSSLSAALSQASRSPSVTANIPSATYEDVKRRLVMGMNTSTQMTMQMPAAPPVLPSPSILPVPRPTPAKSTSSTAGMSAIRKVTAGLTASSKPTPIKTTAAKALTSDAKPKKTKQPSAPRGPLGKRKRTKTEHSSSSDEENDALSTTSLSSLPSPTSTPLPGHDTTTTTAATLPAPTPLTMTKSGRQVLKPTAYNPAAMDAASKRHRTGTTGTYGKRTAEQALCRHCSRMHSPATNQIVFCDGCNDGWHQLCHDPWIGGDVVREQSKGWFCGGCLAKREARQGAGGGKRKGVGGEQQVGRKEKEKDGGMGRGSWAGKPPQQKRAYLSTLPQQELVGLLMACLEVHPDLPVFPVSSAGDQQQQQQQQPRSIFAGTTTEGLFPRADANPTGQINFVRKVAGKGKGSQKEDSQERGNGAEEDEEFDPLAALWPRAGMGMYTRLLPDTEDEARLVDAGDFEAFSVIVYDERGRKVEENGMKV